MPNDHLFYFHFEKPQHKSFKGHLWNGLRVKKPAFIHQCLCAEESIQHLKEQSETSEAKVTSTWINTNNNLDKCSFMWKSQEQRKRKPVSVIGAEQSINFSCSTITTSTSWSLCSLLVYSLWLPILSTSFIVRLCHFASCLVICYPNYYYYSYPNY